MTLTEFYAADAFDLDLMATNLEEVDRDALEQTRLLMWAALAPHSKEKQGPEKLMTFSWERHSNGDQTVTTKEQFEEAFKKFKKA